jgi:hypothetical protein
MKDRLIGIIQTVTIILLLAVMVGIMVSNQEKKILRQEYESLKFEVQTAKYLLEHQRNMTEMYKRMFNHVIKVSDENAKDN